LRTAVLTAAALIGFAANSILCRMALQPRLADAASFTAIRLVSGALVLFVLHRATSEPARAPGSAGSWPSAAALFAYAAAFSFAYVRIGAGVGALLLFGAVQATMIGTGLARGERPARIDWLGMVLAVAGLVVLTRPGLAAPDVGGALLMIVAGVCWGVYSLVGRAEADALSATAVNFVRASLLGLAAVGWMLPRAQWTTGGVVLALASGSLASGVAYTLWYSALPHLPAWRAAIVQLTVPALTGLLAALLLGESITSRLLIATALIAFGVGLTIVPAWHRR
jgi:drug/metabolite transporter (DMT)-like permease